MTSRIPHALVAGAIVAGALIGATAATSAAAAPPRCANSVLGLRPGPTDGAAGTLESVFVFRNAGRATCILGGYPGMAFISASGKVLANRVTRGSSVAFHDPGPRTITLRPGATASYSLAWNDAQTSPCPTTARVLVTPPGSRASITMRTPGATAISVCKGRPLIVSAVVAGSRGVTG